jgi:hypothetical protein
VKWVRIHSDRYETMPKSINGCVVARGYDVDQSRWSWCLAWRRTFAKGQRTYKTAAGARAACERVARRLGVVC